MKQWSALYVLLHSYGVRNSIENLRAFYITPSMHNLISIFRCNFVSVCNIEQKHMHGFSWHFQDRSNIAQGTTFADVPNHHADAESFLGNTCILYAYVCVGGGGGGGGRQVGGGRGWCPNRLFRVWLYKFYRCLILFLFKSESML